MRWTDGLGGGGILGNSKMYRLDVGAIGAGIRCDGCKWCWCGASGGNMMCNRRGSALRQVLMLCNGLGSAVRQVGICGATGVQCDRC